MKLKRPSSLQSWLFSAGAVLLAFMGILWVLAASLAGHEQAQTPGSQNLMTAAPRLALALSIQILEFAGLACLILAALVSVSRDFFSSKPQ